MRNTFYDAREKCYKCYRPKSSCMCEFINSIETKSKFIILMHPKEFKKVKNNTGFFTHQSLSNSELFIGIDFTNNSRINEIIETHESFILFPSKDAINLTKQNPERLFSNSKSMAIFLMDSTWACTNKMFQESKNLQKLQHMSFESLRTSEYKIKEQPRSNYLSTIESTLEVLELLNFWHVEKIEQKSLDLFLNPFHKMVEYQLGCIKDSADKSVRFRKNALRECQIK
ncbi:MAG: tRNA-uridine aminocarboxypropyltransferase [Sulfurimonas sp.]